MGKRNFEYEFPMFKLAGSRVIMRMLPALRGENDHMLNEHLHSKHHARCIIHISHFIQQTMREGCSHTFCS